MNETEKEFGESVNLRVPALLDKKFEIFSSQLRLSIMLILYSYQKVKISELQKAFNVSSGKLEHHLNTLENEGLLRKRVDVFIKRVLTTIEITDKGEEILQDYLKVMQDTLKQMKK